MLIDGTIANWQLGHFVAIVIGVIAMISFLTASYYLESNTGRKNAYTTANTVSGAV
ncbi:MAG: hypothetical protein JRN67_03620 [Nitrososphaerota archaeon]|nr:hypothetical protein [Nitrososphaerota archaeon]